MVRMVSGGEVTCMECEGNVFGRFRWWGDRGRILGSGKMVLVTFG